MQKAQIDALCSQRHWDPAVFTAVFAITSPRVSVLQNWRLAVQYMATRSTTGMMGSTIQALYKWEKFRRIDGPKTYAFYQALLGDPNALVLDVWMARALQVEHKHVTNKGPAATAKRRVGHVARHFGWSIAETQAAIWRGIRHSWGKADDGPREQWRLPI